MPAPVATPEDWGAGSPPAAAERNPFEPAAMTSPPPAPLPVPADKRVKKPAPKPAKPAPSPAEPKTPEQQTAAAWRKTRGGLFWVLFGLLWLTIPGFIGFGKMIYTQRVGDLPQGQGWVSIPGYVNDNTANAVHMTKVDQLDVAFYAVPVLLGGLCLTFGRLTCGAAPRSSGASGLFACSGLFTLLALASLITAACCDKLLFREIFGYTSLGFVILGGLAEFWFLTGLTASGLSLKRPATARAVGTAGFVFALIAAAATVGWTLYAEMWRPKPMNEQWRLYEQAGVMLGWLLMIGVYWRAVRSVRLAISDYLESVPA
jgi:hypothetical protein